MNYVVEIIPYGKSRFNSVTNFKSKLKLVIPSWGLESNLSMVKNVKPHEAVTRFRISAHRFSVEAGLK